MKLNTLAKLALIGLFYIYIIKLIGTLYHGILGPVAFVAIIAGFNILAGIAQLLFFIALYKYFLSVDGKKLQYAGMLAIIGSGIGLLTKFFALAVLIQHQSLFFLIRHGSLFGAFCPWLSALFLLAFCSIVLSDSDIRQNIDFKKAFTAGVVGWSIMFLAHSLVLINFLIAGRLVLVADLMGIGPFIFIMTSTVTLVCLLVFYKAIIIADLLNQHKVVY
jgi:hypothetical protein